MAPALSEKPGDDDPDDALADAPDDDASALVGLAARHGVLGLLPARGSFADVVRQFRLETRDRLVRAHADVRRARAATAAAGADLLVVKGPALAHALYPRPDYRPFADVDVLVPPRSFAHVMDALEAAGGRVLVRNWEFMERHMRSEVSVAMPAGTSLDVHWHLVNDPGLRRSVDLSAARMMSGAVPGPVAGAAVPGHEAHLAYVGWHCTSSGGTRLLWACDVELGARALTADGHGRGHRDGDELAAWARQTGTLETLGVALDFAAAAFPGGAAERLAGTLPDSTWRRVNRRLKRRVLSRPAGGRSGAFLAQATRSGLLRSVAAVRLPLLPGGRPHGPDVLTLDRGGARARREYLAAVARQSAASRTNVP